MDEEEFDSGRIGRFSSFRSDVMVEDEPDENVSPAGTTEAFLFGRDDDVSETESESSRGSRCSRGGNA
jgi:hypothetical protein